MKETIEITQKTIPFQDTTFWIKPLNIFVSMFLVAIVFVIIIANYRIPQPNKDALKNEQKHQPFPTHHILSNEIAENISELNGMDQLV